MSRLIAIEGGDGAGKGSVAASLADALRARGEPVVATREPGGTEQGLALRALLVARGGPAWTPVSELLLMAAARAEHVERLIRPSLAAGHTVLCDRFVGSTVAYQGGGRGLDAAFIARLHRETTGDLLPDLTLLLDVPPETGLARSQARLAQTPALDESRFEALDLAFHRRVRASFLAQAAQKKGWVVIDATQPLAEVRRHALAAC